MKKGVIFLAWALLLIAMSACEEGKCACMGYNSQGDIVVEPQEVKQNHMSNDEACDELKSRYKDVAEWYCLPGRAVSDLVKEL